MNAITARRLAVVAAALATCTALSAAKCGSSGKHTPAAPPPSSTPAIVVSTPPATTSPTPAPSPTATPTTTGGVTGLAGTWIGHWANTVPDQAAGTFQLHWTQSGATLAGTIVIGGTPCLSGGTITGHVSGSTITFGAVHGSVTVTYTGTVAGKSMHGTYATGCGHAQGTWSATHQ